MVPSGAYEYDRYNKHHTVQNNNIDDYGSVSKTNDLYDQLDSMQLPSPLHNHQYAHPPHLVDKFKQTRRGYY